MGLKNGTVILEKNFLKWAKLFEHEKFLLEKLFGKTALQIEHVGSTAVKGLKAKPIVDIAVAIEKMEDIENIITKLECFYTIKNDKQSDEILLIKETSEITYFLIHIMEINSKRYNDMITFRDCIRKNSNIKKQYEELKIKLAKQYKNDRKMYTKAKNDFIQGVLNNINRSF